MRNTSVSARLASKSSFAGKSSRIDLAWIEAMIAHIEQRRQLTNSALAIQMVSEALDQGIPANAAPAQKLAFKNQKPLQYWVSPNIPILALILTLRSSQSSIA